MKMNNRSLMIALLLMSACAFEERGAYDPTVSTVAQGVYLVQDVPRHIAVSHDSQCFLNMKTNGPNLWCWGNNTLGEVGDGTTTPVAVPQLIGVRNYTQISAGYHHFCALSNNAELYCWGWNAEGQLGLNDTVDRHTPTYVGTTPGHVDLWLSITAGWRHTCGLRATTSADIFSNAQLWCWGRGAEGQLSLGTTTNRLIPTALSYWANNVEAGAYHTCATARTQTGTGVNKQMRCTGWNASGQLGDKTVVDRLNFAPVLTSTGAAAHARDWTRISHGGYGHTCAIAAGALHCWGMNLHGQVGLPSSVTEIDYLDNATRCDLTAGVANACFGFLEVSAGYTSTNTVKTVTYSSPPSTMQLLRGMGQDAYNALAFYGRPTAPGLGFWFQYGGLAHGINVDVPVKEVSTDWNRSCTIAEHAGPNYVAYSCHGPDMPADVPPFGTPAWNTFVYGSIVKTIPF